MKVKTLLILLQVPLLNSCSSSLSNAEDALVEYYQNKYEKVSVPIEIEACSLIEVGTNTYEGSIAYSFVVGDVITVIKNYPVTEIGPTEILRSMNDMSWDWWLTMGIINLTDYDTTRFHLENDVCVIYDHDHLIIKQDSLTQRSQDQISDWILLKTLPKVSKFLQAIGEVCR